MQGHVSARGSSVSTTVAADEATVSAVDERLVFRGPMRRWLISPEIGALIGAVVVWSFLWGNGETFGTAGTTLNWLDVAAPYGIMATAVALLMIGGEFDLSSGVITGATAMIIGLMSRFFMGEGVHIGWAILAAFAAAGAIGWFNGYMVNRTGLPSFIITLASFFVMRGLMLVLSKRLAEKVYVDQIRDQRGAKGFRDWVAHEWLLKEFSGRNAIFVTCVLVGAALFIYGLLDQSFVRRSGISPLGLGITAAGLAASLVSLTALLNTDGVGANVLWSLVGSAGIVATIVGATLARWRVSEDVAVPQGPPPRAALLRFGLGTAGVAVACLLPIPFDRNERKAILSWVTDGVRPVIAVAAGLIGLALSIRALRPGLGERVRAAGAVKLGLFSLYAAIMTMALVVSVLQLTTVQALRAMGMLLLGAGGTALILLARGAAAKTHRWWAAAIGLTASVGMSAMALVCRVDSSATRFRTVLPAALIVGAALLAANTLAEFVGMKRTRPFAPADRLAVRLQVAGAVLAMFGIAIRVLFSNLSDEAAAVARAADKPVPQNVLRQTVMWWFIVAAIGAYVLAKTKWGNWIFSVGGNKDAARAVGVPAHRVKIGLFVVVAMCGALSGTLIALRYGTVQADQGTGLEFEFIIAAVVGGCLMTGGYGSVIGASLGAAILAMSTTGFQTVQGWNSDGRYAFLGGVLLVAVLVNTYTRKKAQEAR